MLTGRRTAPTADSTRALARLNLWTGDVAAAEQMLAPFPDDGDTIRGHVEGAILRSRIAAPQDRATALSLLDEALLAAAPLRMRRPFLTHAPGLRELTSARIEAGTAAAAFAVDLLHRMSGQDSPPPATLAEPLTEREQHILRYLASTSAHAFIGISLLLTQGELSWSNRVLAPTRAVR